MSAKTMSNALVNSRPPDGLALKSVPKNTGRCQTRRPFEGEDCVRISRRVSSISQPQILINRLEGDLVIGDKVNVHNTGISGGCRKHQSRPRLKLSSDQREKIRYNFGAIYVCYKGITGFYLSNRNCLRSERCIHDTDLTAVSRRMGTANWREVGTALRFSDAQLDNIGLDCSSSDERSERLLFRWMQWRCEEATVARMAKALFNAGEYDAIVVMDQRAREK